MLKIQVRYSKNAEYTNYCVVSERVLERKIKELIEQVNMFNFHSFQVLQDNTVIFEYRG